jgi:hypothetical protein
MLLDKRNRNMPFRDEELCRQTRSERTMGQVVIGCLAGEAWKSERLYKRVLNYSGKNPL